MLKFLKKTGIRGREGARERELDWERKKTKKVKPFLDKLRRGNPKVAPTHKGEVKQKRKKQRA